MSVWCVSSHAVFLGTSIRYFECFLFSLLRKKISTRSVSVAIIFFTDWKTGRVSSLVCYFHVFLLFLRSLVIFLFSSVEENVLSGNQASRIMICELFVFSTWYVEISYMFFALLCFFRVFFFETFCRFLFFLKS